MNTTAKDIINKHGEDKVRSYMLAAYFAGLRPNQKPDPEDVYHLIMESQLDDELHIEAESHGETLGELDNRITEWLANHPY